jgi:DNA replication and repair protein RecF
VEAIYFCSTFESHRASSTTYLIRDGQSTSSITATLNSSNRSLSQLIQLAKPAQTKVWVNGSPKRKLSEAIGTTSSVIFSPEDLDTIRRDPSDRRRFIDQVVTQLQPRMAGVRADYDRALRQRNALLKSLRAAGRRATNLREDEERSLQIWDEQIVGLGSELTLARVQALSQLTPGFQHFYREISGDSGSASIDPWLSALAPNSLDQDYDSSPPRKNFEAESYAQTFATRLVEMRGHELERGLTLTGPHRDDIVFGLDGLPARFGSSQGEAWSLALGAKLALAALLTEALPTGSPILLLDDVFSVLDPDRRRRLLSHLANYEQVIITATSRDGLPDLNWSKSIRLSPNEPNNPSNQIVKFETEAL